LAASGMLDNEPGDAKLIRCNAKDQHATEPGSIATSKLGIQCGNGEKKAMGLGGCMMHWFRVQKPSDKVLGR
jgi:hypothetical protein